MNNIIDKKHINKILKLLENCFESKPKVCGGELCFRGTRVTKKSFKAVLAETLEAERERLIKCKNCVDKGYNTVLECASYRSRATGKREKYKMEMYRTCRYCDRGKEIEKLKEEVISVEGKNYEN